MGELRLSVPFSAEEAKALRVGDRVLLTGQIYTARDAAHKRMISSILNGGALPFDIVGQVIYYAGPCPARPGEVIGPVGPTTSGRMDSYAPRLIEQGLRGMIGKGDRSDAVLEAMKRYGAVYFAAVGGAGALLASRVRRAQAVAYQDLGTEAVWLLEILDFPVIVAADSAGDNLYREGPASFCRQRTLFGFLVGNGDLEIGGNGRGRNESV